MACLILSVTDSSLATYPAPVSNSTNSGIPVCNHFSSSLIQPVLSVAGNNINTFQPGVELYNTLYRFIVDAVLPEPKP